MVPPTPNDASNVNANSKAAKEAARAKALDGITHTTSIQYVKTN
jgi:hypothetical protein